MIRVLLAEDAQAVRIAIYRLLQSDPEIALVGEAQTHEECLALIKRSPPDVLVTDVGMHSQSESGLSELKDATRICGCSVIAISFVMSGLGLKKLGLHIGADRILDKAGLYPSLIPAIYDVLNERQARRRPSSKRYFRFPVPEVSREIQQFLDAAPRTEPLQARSTGRIRVVIVDDFEPFRRALRRLLETHMGIEVVGDGENFGDAMRLVFELKPDVAVIDISMPAPKNFRRHDFAAVSARANCIVLGTSVWVDAEAQEVTQALGAVARLDKVGLHETLIPTVFKFLEARAKATGSAGSSEQAAS